MPEEEAVRETVASYNQRLDALPPLAKYPELRGMRECVTTYNRGLAEASETSLINVILRANFLHMIAASSRVVRTVPQPSIPSPSRP